MISTVKVTVPAPTQDLTILDTVKEELAITDSANDSMLGRWIREESGNIARYCNRTFGQETVEETFRWHVDYDFYHVLAQRPEMLVLSRTPVVSVSSVVEDTTTLTAEDYTFEDATGFLIRLDSSGFKTRWAGANIVITYVAGYALLDGVPYALEKACLTLIKYRWLARSNPENLRRLDIPGVISKEWWNHQPQTDIEFRGMPADVAGMLESYRDQSL